MSKWQAFSLLSLIVACVAVAQDHTSVARIIKVGELNRSYYLQVTSSACRTSSRFPRVLGCPKFSGKVNTTTGVPCLVHPMSLFGIFSGLEYTPGPAPPCALWTLGETGGPMGARISGATPSGLLVLILAKGGGGPTSVPTGNPCAGILLDLNASMAPFRVLRADAHGRAQIGPFHAPASAAGSVRLQALDLNSCATSNLARIVF